MQAIAKSASAGTPPLVPAMPRSFAVFAWGVLAYNLLVILWGALVRATGSGAGCGGHWPLCNGSVVPEVSQTATVIEFTHRLMSGASLIFVVAMFVWAFKGFPAGHSVRRWASFSLAFILMEALIGAALVLLGHVARDESVGRVYSLAAHLVNTFLLIASLALTAWEARNAPDARADYGPDGTSGLARSNPSSTRGALLLLSLVALIVVAVAGAITALGDTLFPPDTLAQGITEDFAQTSNFLIRLRIIHPTLAIGAGLLISSLALRAFRASMGARRTLAGLLLALVTAQVVAGALTVALKAPIALQLLHLLIADFLWISLVLFSRENMRENRLV